MKDDVLQVQPTVVIQNVLRNK